MIVWGLARIAYRDMPLLEALASRTTETSVLASFTPQGVGNVAWYTLPLSAPTPTITITISICVAVPKQHPTAGLQVAGRGGTQNGHRAARHDLSTVRGNLLFLTSNNNKPRHPHATPATSNSQRPSRRTKPPYPEHESPRGGPNLGSTYSDVGTSNLHNL